jgi:hypothetical protein
VDFKVPLPIPEWKNLEIRIYKTSHRQVPINHQEFNSIRDKLYQYVLNYLQNNPDNARNTEASHNHWSAALQCGVWECSNADSLRWYKVAIATATGYEYRGWAKNERSTHLIRILPHESFSKFTAAQYLESVHFYHRDLHIPSWKVLHEYRQPKGARVLIAEVNTQYLEAAKRKAGIPEAGVWRLQGMGMPMKFSMATPIDLHKVPVSEISALSQSASRPSTPHTPARNQPATGTPQKVPQGAKITTPKPTTKNPQQGSATPITKAMSGFSLASPHRVATPTLPPAPAMLPPMLATHTQVPIQHVPVVDQQQGTYYAYLEPGTQMVPQIPPQFQQPYQMVAQYQPQYQYMNPPPLQQMGVQQYQPVVPMPCPQQQQTLPQDQPSYSREEMEEALQVDDGDHVEIDENYMDLLEEGGEDTSATQH